MKTTQNANRRKFLLAAGIGSAGAAAAVVTAGKAGKPAVKETEAAPQTTTYHASEHILKYYKTTEV